MIAEAEREWTREFHLRFVRFDRSRVGGGDATHPRAIDSYIERRAGVDTGLAFRSFLAEMALLQTAQMLVATSVSVTSRMALFAIAGAQGHVPPYVMVDRPFDCAFCQG